jgi:hypothetical protein
LANIGNVILPKPVLADLQELREGGILWGWPHCVQQWAHTQAAIDRKQTLIAFEDMFVWGPNGEIGRHTFYKNNEMAGYCAVLHALQLKGIDGHYGNQRKTKESTGTTETNAKRSFLVLVRSAVAPYTPLRHVGLEVSQSAFSVPTTRYVRRYLIVIW